MSFVPVGSLVCVQGYKNDLHTIVLIKDWSFNHDLCARTCRREAPHCLHTSLAFVRPQPRCETSWAMVGKALEQVVHISSRLSLTCFLHLFLNSAGWSRHIRAASTFAGLSSFGLESMLMTEIKIVSGVCTGDHRSEADS